MKRSVILILLSLVVVITTWLLLFNERGDSAKNGDRERVAVVKRGDRALKVIETGSVEPATAVEIKSEQSGVVKQLFVAEGDQVTRGQRLAVIEQESTQAQQAAQYRADMEREQLALEEAERGLRRNRVLHEKGFLSLQEVEVSEQNVEHARIRHALARRKLKLVLGGNEETLTHYLRRPLESDRLEEFSIRSPIDGTVITLGAEEGEIISSGTSTVTGGTVLMELADLRRMVVKTLINEVNIARVTPGQEVEIRLDAILGKVYHGEVGLIAPQGVRTDNIVTYEVTITITDADDQLKPTMTANIDILTGTITDALYLPLEAIDHQLGRDYVWVRRGTDVVKQLVIVTLRTEVEAIIRADSTDTGANDRVSEPLLREGDQVIIPKPRAPR